jgi:stage II sporulation protein D
MIARAGNKSLIIENSSSCRMAIIKLDGRGIFIQCGSVTMHASEVIFTSRDGGTAEFRLAIPGKITRCYRGKLQVIAHSKSLVPIVTMDLETAVMSVVAAEDLPNTPIEALKAQAVVARSYLLAGKGRHHDFDFCDTTHCQFLREPPQPNSPAAIATRTTRGLVLGYQNHMFAAMYTRSCSGHTRTPSELGMPTSSYPYFSVECKYCREHPVHWQSRISAADSTGLRNFNEDARIALVRRLGWSTIPSDDFTTHPQGSMLLVEGVGQGHGMGLCEAGARAMAADGADFRQILAHYYPNTTPVTVATEIAGAP